MEEEIGCGEVEIHGKRDNVPAHFGQAAVVAEVAGAGFCLHCDYGIRTQLPRADEPNQQACAEAACQARLWFRPEAQRWHRTRAGLGDSALVLDDAHALRVYMRLGEHEGQAVAVQPDKAVNYEDPTSFERDRYKAVGQNGWRVVRQSSDGAFIDLAR